MSNPYALPVGPTRLADSSTSIPPPDPRSSTTSPACNFASAVGFPQPSEAATASAGSPDFCASSYKFLVIGSHPLNSPPSPQHAVPPAATCFAACPYFCLTASWMFVSLTSSLLDSLSQKFFTAKSG